MCGIIGIYNNPEAATLAYMGLYAQQHRGQEGAGIVAGDGHRLSRVMGQGLVSDVFKKNKVFRQLQGDIAIGHVRYSTTGEDNPNNVGPLLFNLGDSRISIAHNGNLVNIKPIIKDLQKNGSLFQTSTDTEIIIHLLAREQAPTVSERLAGALTHIEGAYSLLLISPNELIAARDPMGIRPLCIGKLKESYVISSETCALDLLGAEYLREVEPGELITINRDGFHSIRIAKPAPPRHCIFEYIYFSRPDSRIFKDNVDRLRRKFGKILAEDHPAETADIVISVPDSSNTCALGYAQCSGVKYEIGLIRNHYIGRTFIFPNQRLRDLSVKLKFNTVKGVLENKEVVIVDDSIVRGTTLRKLARVLRDAGAKKVHVRISSPPVRYPCYYGMDFPTREELIANQKTQSEIRDLIDVDSLEYLSIDGLLRAVDDSSKYCTACFSGKYPTEIKDLND